MVRRTHILLVLAALLGTADIPKRIMAAPAQAPEPATAATAGRP